MEAIATRLEAIAIRCLLPFFRKCFFNTRVWTDTPGVVGIGRVPDSIMHVPLEEAKLC